MKDRYKFTVFTPCYNSIEFIHRVYDCLYTQDFRDFEWLVIDDASTDYTLSMLEEFEKQANFDMRIIKNKTNQMITRNYRIGIDNAKGDILVPLGHDDTIKKDTLSILQKTWEEHGADNLSGIWGICEDQDGKMIGDKFPEDTFIENYFNIFVDYLWKNEGFPCFRTEVLKKYKSSKLCNNEKLDHVSDGLLWAAVSLDYDTIFVNNILRVYYIDPDNLNALTKRTRVEIASTVVHERKIWLNHFMTRINKSYLFKIRIHFSFAFYSYIDNEGFLNNIRTLNTNINKIICISMLPMVVLAHYYLKTKRV